MLGPPFCRFSRTVLKSNSFKKFRAVKQASLDRSAHTKAGDLSGGQKRRLKIALELLVDRQILFLGEPTGLPRQASPSLPLSPFLCVCLSVCLSPRLSLPGLCLSLCRLRYPHQCDCCCCCCCCAHHLKNPVRISPLSTYYSSSPP